MFKGNNHPLRYSSEDVISISVFKVTYGIKCVILHSLRVSIRIPCNGDNGGHIGVAHLVLVVC